ncbi:indole-3-glycerol phosphate synthase TrpC [Legionella israelensis]|uniref:Indole-3-glycerol phosphate synthase n=1 Tax=Legionella israelensis TaxID=454 RepID=A0A0W0VUD8_9GAMM|nr:indole-3-glycerol phosphate synthase TrpC [Legionella israelensis]KTD23731.1 indole-3-glycerol phosphate synthase [Legionella israelensis]QBS10889.1 indole-3-glycerol phosphate synthase TrpC [Legionella israelensis]SCX80384.1 indole-3-glycerol phosphate synthase [Legionella israelensis DSM 19235]STX57875.1 indole-3-glycerol phosphate synthase [Legionella israelensis]
MNNQYQSILQNIAKHKAIEVSEAKKKHPVAMLKQQKISKPRDFLAALSDKSTPAIIAEIKRASPSKGLIREDFNVGQIAEIYEANGARCLSVLTDIDFFQGHPDFLAIAKSHCSLPILRKDFIIDSYQIHESLYLQADCILLIAAILDNVQLHDYCQLAQELGLAVLVESHTKDELERALNLPTPLMGINNRSLHHFTTDLKHSIELSQMIPKDKLIIAESGINSYRDVQLLQQHGIHIFLIGESLMRAENIGNQLQCFIKGSPEPHTP